VEFFLIFGTRQGASCEGATDTARAQPNGQEHRRAACYRRG